MTIDPDRIRDFSYYASSFLKIKTPKEQVIPFLFNASQLRLHNLWEHLLQTVGYVMIIILKARRQGMSTYCEGRIFHKSATNPNVHAFVMAHDKKSLDTIFNMSKLFYDELPPSLKPMIRYSSKKELVFENPRPSERYSLPGLRSRIEVIPARNSDSLRSGGYTAAHFSEVAFYDDPEGILGPYVPTIPKTPGSFVVYESTANGRGNFFHEEWLAARRGRSNFTPIFFSWLEFSEYSLPFHSRDEELELKSTLDEEEKRLLRKYNATYEQLHWRRHQLLDMQEDVDLFHQEFPCDDEEAFISSGRPYFNRTKLYHLQSQTSSPSFVGDISQHGLLPNDDGPLQIWHHPEPSYSYCIGVDVGGGSADGDPSAIEVLRVPKDSPHILQCAEWHGHIDPVLLASRVIFLARYYNDALVCPEINNHGIATLNEIKEHYWNIYRWQYFDHLSRFDSNKLGWVTNVSTKPLLCDYTSACINSDILLIESPDLIDEMLSFIISPSGSGEADLNSYDDRVMAFMIALFCLSHSYLSSSLLTSTGKIASKTRPPEPRVIPPPDYAYDSDQGETSSNSWLYL